jgi:hypothetical protein
LAYIEVTRCAELLAVNAGPIFVQPAGGDQSAVETVD